MAITTPPPVTPKQLAALSDQILNGNPITRSQSADQLAQLETLIDPQWIVTVYDKLWRPIAEVGDDMIELTGIVPRNNVPTAKLTIKGSSTLIDIFRQCSTTMIGVTVETEGLRFAYYVDTFDHEYKQDGSQVCTANLLGIYDILSYLVIWPNFLLPIQAQIPSHAVFIWALCTVVECMVSECALRIQSGLWEFVNNALSLNPDISAWFGTLLQSNGNVFQMLKTPIYVTRTNPLLDTSPLVAKTVRMETCATVITDITRAYGVDVNVDLWLPGDTQPDTWANLDQPTYVVSTKDRSQISGPTGTVLDSVMRTIVDLGGSFGLVFPGIINAVPGMQAGVFYSPLLGQHYVAPWAVLIAPEPGEKGSIMTCKITDHTPKAWQQIIGGRSPKWLNDLMNATFSWIIDSISILVGIVGLPSDLMSGFLNNAFLAFQLIELYSRRNDMGPYHPCIEKFNATASSPYNIETVFDFLNAFWDSRGYTSAIATFRNGEVYTLGRDVFKGGLMSILYHGRRLLYTDYVDNIMFRVNETTRDVMVQIGDGKKEEAPMAKHQRFLTGIFESLNVLTLAPQS